MKHKNQLYAIAAINDLAYDAHRTALEKGFWDFGPYPNFDLRRVIALAMIHTEVSEAVEAIRSGKSQEEILEELADIIIRTLDLAEAMDDENTDFGRVLVNKMIKNKAREHKHGKKF